MTLFEGKNIVAESCIQLPEETQFELYRKSNNQNHRLELIGIGKLFLDGFIYIKRLQSFKPEETDEIELLKLKLQQQ